MPPETAASRRIMQAFGEETHIPYLPLSEGDVGVLVAGPLAGLFVAGLSGVQSLALPLVVAGLLGGVVTIYASPPHVSAGSWLAAIARYVYRPRQTFNAPSDSAGTSSAGGLGQYSPFSVDESTQDLTNISRAWPGAGAIERTDGAMEAYLELRPGNMDFAMATDWADRQAAGAAFANTELDAKLKLHATTRSFPVERITATIEDRLDDPDVQSNPVFAELLEEYRETRPREMREQGLVELRYYLGVTVDPFEVYEDSRDEATPAEKLTRLPLLGIFFQPFVTRRVDLSATERRARMFERLDDRLASLETEFVQPAGGWTSRRLSTVELFALSMAFWNGQPASGDPEHLVRDSPVMDHATREVDLDD